MKVVIISRVSTNLQDNKRQVEELKEFSNKMNFDVIKVYEEKISGAKENDERINKTNIPVIKYFFIKSPPF